jgi:hypothetical protein
MAYLTLSAWKYFLTFCGFFFFRFANFWHNTEKWLVKSAKMRSGWRFAEGLVKVVSLKFFCRWQRLKKAVLGLWEFGCNSLGHQAKKAAVQMQGLWHSLHPIGCYSATQKSFCLVSEVGAGAPDL